MPKLVSYADMKTHELNQEMWTKKKKFGDEKKVAAEESCLFDA